MSYERLAGSPKHQDRVVRRSKNRKARAAEQRLEREDKIAARHAARKARAAARVEQKLQAKRDREDKKRFASRVVNEDRLQRQTSAASYKQRKADEAARRAERHAPIYPAPPRVLPPLPYSDPVPKTSAREMRREQQRLIDEQWRRDNPEAAAAQDAYNAKLEAQDRALG